MPYKDILRHLYLRTIASYSKLINKNISELKEDIFTNKNIIIIGPAQSSLSYLSPDEIDNFDYIVRVNKSHLNLEANSAFIGSRTDILFHCFHQDPIYGGGEINLVKLSQQQNKYLVYPYYTPKADTNFYRYALKNPHKTLHKLPKHYYQNLASSTNNFIPTTGLQALNYFIAQNFSELHITGFTFFRTAYVQGYRDSHQQATDAANLAKSQGNHDPEVELMAFKNLYDFYVGKDKRIYLDNELSSILASI